MKKYILNFAVAILTLSAVVSCKNEGDRQVDEVPQADIEETSENISSQEVSGHKTKELEDTQLVPSGTYTGQAVIVDSEQKEVYVKLNDTTTIELYFSNETSITNNGQQVQFDALEEGQQVEVEVERSGESLKPKTVRIL